jgi:hypothetical protein
MPQMLEKIWWAHEPMTAWQMMFGVLVVFKVLGAGSQYATFQEEVKSSF